MAKDQKTGGVRSPNMDEDFTQWYTDVCTKAELIDYTSVKGMFDLSALMATPSGKISSMSLDTPLQGNRAMRMCICLMLIPESLLQKEKDHVEGFAPEVRVGDPSAEATELADRLCVRPTSETLFCEHYANIIHSWRDLPKLYNQWCSVIALGEDQPSLPAPAASFCGRRGIPCTPLLRKPGRKPQRMLNVYADFLRKCAGHACGERAEDRTRKSSTAPRKRTRSECMMHDKKALQSGTSPLLRRRVCQSLRYHIHRTATTSSTHPFQTSWGVSTRMIGGIIMTHGDNNGLVLPPRIAPIQVVVIPVAQHKPGVLDAAADLTARLKAAGIRVKMDASEQFPGWKFAEYEMKGVPLRLEIGPKDIEKAQCVIARRDNGEKTFVALSDLESAVPALLDQVHDGLYAKARENLENHTYAAATLEEAKAIQEEKGGFVKTMWCGDLACEMAMKEKAGMTSRCIPFAQEHLGDVCPVCGKPAVKMVYWGVAY